MHTHVSMTPVMYTDPSGEIAILTMLAIGFVVGMVIGGGFEVGNQMYQHGMDFSKWDGKQIALSSLGGAIAGTISAIPIGGPVLISYLGTFILGGTASVIGGYISGAVDITNRKSVTTAFLVGGVANVFARGVSNMVSKRLATKASYTLNHSHAFDSMTLGDLSGTALRNNGLAPAYNKVATEGGRLVIQSFGYFSKSMVYSTINSGISSGLSGW